jgi:hypothetical protein
MFQPQVAHFFGWLPGEAESTSWLHTIQLGEPNRQVAHYS